MIRSTGARLLIGLALAVLLTGCGPYVFRGSTVQPPDTAPEITLADQDGRPFRLSEQGGRVVVLFFGFGSCPDICPTALADLANARRQLGDDARDIQVAMVTLDPERDSPAALGRYVTRFDPTFLGLSGTPEQLEAAQKAYGVTAIRRDLPGSALKYTVDHSGYIYVIDRAGRWRSFFHVGSSVEDMVSDLRFLARER
ncbi:MAG TPA: SCO family protein [Roseiflexaceae bacterium]|nr:SCO family protein [Roseiflexaceae bacterium]